jgi:PAS domain S-box-containing protein
MHPTSQPEETFRLIVEGAPNAIVVIDESGHVVIVNSQTEKLFGYSRDELAVSGYGQQSDRQQSQDAGIDHHMTKPVDPDALRDVLAAAI